MENLCWNCGSATHHSRACKHPNNPAIRKEIKDAFKQESGHQRSIARNKIQLVKMNERASLAASSHLPSIKHFSNEINRLEQVIYDMKFEVDELPTPIGSVSADCLESRLRKVLELRKGLDLESGMIRYVGSLKQPYKLSPSVDSDDILLQKVNYLKENQAVLSNKLNSIYRSLKTASSITADFRSFQVSLMTFIEQGIEAFSGRPLQISATKREWNARKSQITSAQELLETYYYLFNEEDNFNLSRILTDVKEAWAVLKSMKREHEKEASKYICPVCYELDITHTIVPCGHTYCSICIAAIDTCAVCRGRIQIKLKLHF